MPAGHAPASRCLFQPAPTKRLPLLPAPVACREQVLLYAARLQAAAVATKQPPPENMLTCLAELFVQASAPALGLTPPPLALRRCPMSLCRTHAWRHARLGPQGAGPRSALQ